LVAAAESPEVLLNETSRLIPPITTSTDSGQQITDQDGDRIKQGKIVLVTSQISLGNTVYCRTYPRRPNVYSRSTIDSSSQQDTRYSHIEHNSTVGLSTQAQLILSGDILESAFCKFCRTVLHVTISAAKSQL
jgi:hypothetical protein